MPERVHSVMFHAAFVYAFPLLYRACELALYRQ